MLKSFGTRAKEEFIQCNEQNRRISGGY